jgi:esterase
VNIEIDGLEFSYLTWGDADAPPLVMLHGFTGHARTWRHLASSLPERRVIALDQRGHGDSAWADVYGAKPMVVDLERFVDALELRTFELLGLSMGGINAIAYAGVHSDLLSRLVIVDIGPVLGASGIARIGKGVRAGDVFASEDDAFAQARAGNAIADETLLRERVHHNLRPADGGGVTFKWDRALRDGSAVREDFTPDELWTRWDAIAVPTLLVRGELSDVLDAPVAEEMVSRNPRARLETVAGSGHTVPLDRPAELASLVRQFLLQ